MKDLLAIAFAGLLAACGPALIEGTNVPDTQENRELLDVLDRYRQALEARDAQALADIVSPRYFENASSTSDAKDDYGFVELIQKVLPVLQDNVVEVQYKIKVDRIDAKGRQASIYYEWEMTFKYIEGGLEGWSTAKDKNRMDLALEGDSWKILAGL